MKFDVDGGDFVPVMRADLKHINDRLLNLARNVGGSVGIALVGAQLVRNTQIAHAERMVAHYTAGVAAINGSKPASWATLMKLSLSEWTYKLERLRAL